MFFLHILNQLLNIAYGVPNHRFYFIPEHFVLFLKHRTEVLNNIDTYRISPAIPSSMTWFNQES